MRFEGNKIYIDKEINELDRFVIEFIKILEKHTDYVIVSGYVAILLGRARGTEDVDVFVEEMDKLKFRSLYEELEEEGYWCLNTSNADEMFDYLDEGSAVRLARKDETIPNFEVKFAKKRLAKESFNDRIDVITKSGVIKISSLERQIAFKRYMLKSDKDLEDAKHIEEIFKEHINKDKIMRYKSLIENA